MEEAAILPLDEAASSHAVMEALPEGRTPIDALVHDAIETFVWESPTRLSSDFHPPSWALDRDPPPRPTG